MIMETSKPLHKASRQELQLLLLGEDEAKERLVKLLDKAWDHEVKKKEDEKHPSYVSPEKRAYLDGLEFATNIVRDFYNIRD